MGLLPQAPAAASARFAAFGDEYMSLMRGLLTFDPNDRLDAATSCRHSLFEELRLSIDESCIQLPPQMMEETLRCDVADSATIADLRRTLYGEISAFAFATAADTVAASAANAAAASAERTDIDTNNSSNDERIDRLASPSRHAGTTQAACSSTSAAGCSRGSRLEPLLPTGSYDEECDRLCSDKGNADAATKTEDDSDEMVTAVDNTCALSGVASKSDDLGSVISDRNFPRGSDSRQRGPSTRQCPGGVGLHFNLEKREVGRTRQRAGEGNSSTAFRNCCGSKPKPSD